MAAFKKERKMKVYAQSGYRYKDTATIILKHPAARRAAFSFSCFYNFL